MRGGEYGTGINRYTTGRSSSTVCWVPIKGHCQDANSFMQEYHRTAENAIKDRQGKRRPRACCIASLLKALTELLRSSGVHRLSLSRVCCSGSTLLVQYSMQQASNCKTVIELSSCFLCLIKFEPFSLHCLVCFWTLPCFEWSDAIMDAINDCSGLQACYHVVATIMHTHILLSLVSLLPSAKKHPV